MLFQIEETVTATDWSAWLTAHACHSGPVRIGLKGTSFVLRIIGCLFIAFGALLALLSLLSGGVNLLTLIGVVLVLLGVSWLRGNRSAGQTVSANHSKWLKGKISDTALHLSFEDDTFFVCENGKSSSYHYHAISDCWEDKDRFYLFLDGKMNFILRKDAFVLGTTADFSTFLCEKVGNPTQYIKIN